MSDADDGTPRRKADVLGYRALGALSRGDPRRARELAWEAIDLDAAARYGYYVLAKTSGDLDFRRTNLEHARELSRERIPEKLFEQHRDGGAAVRPWDDLVVRPHLDATYALMDVCRELGDEAKALELCRELLRMDPRDPRGVRVAMADLLEKTWTDIREPKEGGADERAL